MKLMDKPISGKFDFKHLQAIHRYIFQDVYDWAGKVRTVDIAKGNMFCNVRFISGQADEIFTKLKQTWHFTPTQQRKVCSFALWLYLCR